MDKRATLSPNNLILLVPDLHLGRDSATEPGSVLAMKCRFTVGHLQVARTAGTPA
jgi:hypothetical protein